MKPRNNAFITLWGRGLSVATAVFLAGSILIVELVDHHIPRKEVFYCWLLVFFNAYIGTFIANQAVKQQATRFFMRAFLINGLRIGLFLILLLFILKLGIVNVRGFVLMTFFGYFAFLAAEIYGLHQLTIRKSQDPQSVKKDD